MARGFISYKHEAQPDVCVAELLVARLMAAGHQVFLDTQIEIGKPWPEVIDAELAKSEFLVVLLSSASSLSEMVIAEVQIGHRHRRNRGLPRILPVRVAFTEELPYDLAGMLGRLQPAHWQGRQDDDRLCAGILASLADLRAQDDALPRVSAVPEALATDGCGAERPDAVLPPLPSFDPRWLEILEAPGGSVRLKSPFYVEREMDLPTKNEVCRDGATLTLTGSRQSGKSSMLARLYQHARDAGHPVVYIDFQRLDEGQLGSLDALTHHIADLIALKQKTNQGSRPYWDLPLGPSTKLTHFLEEEVLPHLEKPIVLLMDEVDRLFAYEYRSDFFGLLRSWHNNRAFDESWNRLNLVLAISTESNLLIADHNQSPFNVGYRVDASDFTSEQMRAANDKHGSPVKPHEMSDFERLLQGQPFLVRSALYELVSRKWDFAHLLARAYDDDGPFRDHLRRYLLMLNARPDLRAAMKDVIQYGKCATDAAFYGLRAMGLVVGHSRLNTSPRCGLYSRYLGDRL